MAKKANKIAKEARMACEKWRTWFKYNIDQYHEIQQFVLGRQWKQDEEDMLQTFKKVPLQFNKLATLVNTLLGEQQQNTPQLDVRPLSTCDEQTAEIRAIITKDIMLSTDAKTVYQQAASQAFTGGFGAYMYDTYYKSQDSWDLEICLRSCKDPTRYFWDISADDVCKTDGMHAGYYYRMSRAKFRAVHGKDIEEKILKDANVTQSEEEIALVSEPGRVPDGDQFSWADDDSITILHYYKRTYVKDTLYKMSNGKTLNQDEMGELILKSQEFVQKMQQSEQMQPDMFGEMPQQNMGEGSEINGEWITLYDDGEPVRIEDKRPVKKSKIMHYHIAGDYILEKSEFPSEDLPIIFMDQHSFYQKDGKQVCRPFIIDCIDAQRYLNYLGTQSAFILKVSRYDQFMMSKQNARGLDTQKIWTDPSNIQGALYYDESPSGAKPEQLMPPELSRSLMEQYQRAQDDLYTSTGMYPARLGQQGTEVSGAAVDARTRQGNNPTFVAFNSVSRAVAGGGKIANQMVPRVYDTERVIRLLNPMNGESLITVNKQSDEYGALIENDIRKGSFEVILQAGPSYEGQKSQALESLNGIIQADPQLFSLIADLYAENLPLANTIEIKNRLKTLVPPQIIEAGKTGKMPPPQQQQPDPQQVLAQQDMQIKQGQLQLKQQEIQQKAQAVQAANAIEMQKLEKEYAELEAQVHDMTLRYAAENYKTQANIKMGHADNMARILTHNPGLHNEQRQSAGAGR